MIIGYYPGAGGNRYFEFINNRDYTITNRIYDNLTNNIISRGRYLDKPEDKLFNNRYKQNYNILLHSVNYYQIKEIFPVHDTEFIFIKADLKSSLQREWSLKGKFKAMNVAESDNDDILLGTYNAIHAKHWPKIHNIEEYHNLSKLIKDEVENTINKSKVYLSDDGIYNYLNSAYTAICWHNDLYTKFPWDAGPAQSIDITTSSDEFSIFMRKELSQYNNNELFNFAWDVYEKYGTNAAINSLFDNRNKTLDII